MKNRGIENVKTVENVDHVFQNMKKIGQGRLGTVFAGESRDGTKYALKKISKVEILSLNFAFHKEILLLQNLGECSLLKYHETYVDKKDVCIVTEYAEGGDLFDFIKQKHITEKGYIGERICQVIIHSVLKQIELLHKKNIFHGDIKPENIVFRKKNRFDEAVLIDYGSASTIFPKNRYFGLVGTPCYMAPEIIRRMRSGSECLKSDMWALGCVAFILTSGRLAFSGKDHKIMFQRIKKAKIKFKYNRCSENGKDFMKKIFTPNAEDRLSAKEGLSHPWIKSISESGGLFFPERLSKKKR